MMRPTAVSKEQEEEDKILFTDVAVGDDEDDTDTDMFEDDSPPMESSEQFRNSNWLAMMIIANILSFFVVAIVTYRGSGYLVGSTGSTTTTRTTGSNAPLSTTIMLSSTSLYDDSVSSIIITNPQSLKVACQFLNIPNITQCSTITSFRGIVELPYVTTTTTIPTEIGLLTQLTVLDLYHHHPLTGTIPSTLGQLTQLMDLALGMNQLTRTIPSTLGLLMELAYLALYGNQLTGTIPSALSTMHLVRPFT